MRNETRVKYNALMAQLATLNNVPDAAQKFSVAPAVQQKLETRIQESSDFLSQINNVPVTEQSGEKIGLGIGSTIASTVNTAGGNRRTPIDPSALDSDGYICTQTNFDTAISYAKLDMWAKFPNFQIKMRDAITMRQALDIICIGFNGISRAAQSNRTQNPLLQDVNIGWLQKMRLNAAARVMDTGVTNNVIKIGETGTTDFKNIDALVMDMVNNLINPWYRKDPNLVAVMGGDMLADKYFPLVNKAQDNSEKISADIIISQKRVGNLQAVTVPFFPDGTIMVTRLDNLSRYYQEEARRRLMKDEPEFDRIANYESSNDAYVIEDYGLAAVAEKIQLV